MGNEFVYIDPLKPTWAKPEDTTSVNSTIGQTLQQYYSNENDSVSKQKQFEESCPTYSAKNFQRSKKVHY